MTSSKLKGINGAIYILGERIGTGGEGSVYLNKLDNAQVIKLYHEKLDANRIDKLIEMIKISNKQLTSFSAWPIDLVKDETGMFIGFVMNKVINSEPLHRLFTPHDRLKFFPNSGYNFLVHVARNLAIAIDCLHSFGIIVGDLNEGNILVNKDGLIRFIDCDSFQIKHNDIIFYCEVGVVRYTAPEILTHGTFQNVERTKSSDSFSIAILIFQLLFLGRHPFVGANFTHEDIDEARAIKEFIFPYSNNNKSKKLSVPRNTLNFNYLSHVLQELFIDTFEKNPSDFTRPKPKQWINELESFYKSLKRCDKSKFHFYSPLSTHCPWCEFKNKGIYYFAEELIDTHKIEFKDLEPILKEGKIGEIFIRYYPGSFDYKKEIVSPSALPRRFYTVAYRVYLILASLGLFIVCLAFVDIRFLLGFIVLAIGFANRKEFMNELKYEEKRRKNEFTSLKTKYDALVKEYNAVPQISNLNNLKVLTENNIASYRQLPDSYNREKAKIDDLLYQRQLNKFLSQFRIRDASIPQIGPARRNTLEAYGIYTAGDISKLDTLSIPRFSFGCISELKSWRRKYEPQFVYIPDKIAFQNEISLLDKKYDGLRKERMDIILNNLQEGLRLKNQIDFKRHAIKNQIEGFSLQLKQAEVDLQEMSNKFKKI